MAKNIFMGINGVARKVPKVYIGDNDVARKIKKAYIGDANGKAHLFFSGGVDVASIAITYTGNYTDKVVTMSGKTYRLLTLTSSGTLNLETEVAADVWMCSGGTSGNDGNVSSKHKQYAGGGGAGGFAKQFSAQLAEGDHVAVIGAGGSKISASTSNTFNPGFHTSFDNQQTEGTFVLGNTTYLYYGTSGGTGGGGGRGGGSSGYEWSGAGGAGYQGVIYVRIPLEQ